MKMLSVLGMVIAVGVLGMAVFFITNDRQTVNLNIKASTNMTVVGELTSDDPEGCGESFYIGCYELITSDGKNYDLVEGTENVNFNPYIGQNVSVVGNLAPIEGKNVLIVSSVNPAL